MITEHIDGSVPYWHTLIIAVMAEIRLLHSQLFMNSHFQFLVIVESAPSKVLCQWPKLSTGQLSFRGSRVDGPEIPSLTTVL